MSIAQVFGIGFGLVAISAATDFPHKGSWWFALVGVGLMGGALGAGLFS